MTRSRSFTGTVTAAVLVAVFANQWISDWIAKQATGDTVLTWLAGQLIAPSWSFNFGGTNEELRLVIARDARAVLTVLLVYILLVSFRKTFPEGFSGFVLGWSTLVFASAVAAFASTFIAPGASVVDALDATGPALTYGLFLGWIVGFVTSVGRNIPLLGGARNKESAAA